jgi:hypothetical protein
MNLLGFPYGPACTKKTGQGQLAKTNTHTGTSARLHLRVPQMYKQRGCFDPPPT